MKKIFISLILSAFLFSCENNRTIVEQKEMFEIQKYKGFIVMYKVNEDWRDLDEYILRNDTCAIELRVPTWFGELYKLRDTIK